MRFRLLRIPLLRCILLICSCLPVLAAPAPALADEADATCSSWEELYTLLQTDPGGTIRLTGNANGLFLIDKLFVGETGEKNTLVLTQPVTLDLGENGMEFYAYLNMTGPVTFTGTGTQRPVMRVQATERPQMLSLTGCTIIATGERATPESMPPTALKLEHQAATTELIGTLVQATGAGAIAVDHLHEVSVSMQWAVISATGEGGVAVRAQANRTVKFLYCDITGPVIAPADTVITLIGCHVEAQDPQANTLRIPAAAKAPAEPYSRLPFLKVLCPVNGQPTLPQTLEFTLLYPDMYPDLSTYAQSSIQTSDILWDTSSVNWAVPGEYRLKGTARLPISTLPVENLYSFEVPCGVYDPAGLYLPYGAMASMGMGRNFLDLPVLPLPQDTAVAPQAGLEISLYYSADEGKSWELHALADGSNAASYEDGFDVFRFPLMDVLYLMDGNPHWYYAALSNADGIIAESNTLILQFDADGLQSTMGGDRDLGDRTQGNAGDGGAGADAPSLIPPEHAATQAPAAAEQTNTTGSDRAPAQFPLGAPQELSPLPTGSSFPRQHLLDLIVANPQAITLFESEVQLVFPTDTLHALLGEADALHIDAGLDGTDGLLLRLFAGEAEVFELPEGIAITFAYTHPDAEAGEVFLVLGDQWIPATYADGQVTASIFATGEYAIVVRAAQAPQSAAAAAPGDSPALQMLDSIPTPSPETQDFPLLPVAAGVAVTGGGAAAGSVFLRRRGRIRRRR